ncbi:hypothetical protein MRX96_024364 [Rhipicephalus microplus]
MVPLVLSAPTSTDKVPALPRLFPTASRGVMGANLWDWKTSVTSPCEEDIKPRPLQRHLSGSGGATAAMSLKHAWLILQMVPLVLSAPTSTDKVPVLPRIIPDSIPWRHGGQPMGLEDFGDVTMRRRHKTSPASAAPQWERRRYSSNVAETCVAYLADGAARAQCSNIDRQSPGPAQIIPDSIPWRHGGQPMGLEDFGDVTMRRRHKTSPASAAPQWERRRYSSNVAETCVAYLADGAARAQCSNIDRQSPGPAQIIPDSIPWRHGGQPMGLEDFGDVTMRRRHKTSPASAAPQWERRRYSSNVAETCVAYLADGAARAQCSNIDRQSPGPAQIIPDSIPWRHGGQPMGLEDFGDVTMRRRHKTSPASAAPQWERRRYSSNVAETCVAYLADGAARAQCSNIDRQSPGPAQIIPDSIPWRHGGPTYGTGRLR